MNRVVKAVLAALGDPVSLPATEFLGQEGFTAGEDIVLCPYCEHNCAHSFCAFESGDTTIAPELRDMIIFGKQGGYAVGLYDEAEPFHFWFFVINYHKGQVFYSVIYFPDNKIVTYKLLYEAIYGELED